MVKLASSQASVRAALKRQISLW